MLTLETIEELEFKVIKALDLISDLRTENARLETENESLRLENDKMKLALEEKERELGNLRTRLQDAENELKSIKERESNLEGKVNNLLGRLSSLPSSSKAEKSPSSSEAQSSHTEDSNSEETASADNTIGSGDTEPTPAQAPGSSFVEVNEEVETVEDEDEIILLDDEDEEVPPEVPSNHTEVESVAELSATQPAEPVEERDFEDTLLDDPPMGEPSGNTHQAGDVSIHIEHDEDIIMDDSEEVISIFDADESEDFLIIEEESR
jgi:chromosome segregation ATPase